MVNIPAARWADAFLLFIVACCRVQGRHGCARLFRHLGQLFVPLGELAAGFDGSCRDLAGFTAPVRLFYGLVICQRAPTVLLLAQTLSIIMSSLLARLAPYGACEVSRAITTRSYPLLMPGRGRSHQAQGARRWLLIRPQDALPCRLFHQDHRTSTHGAISAQHRQRPNQED